MAPDKKKKRSTRTLPEATVYYWVARTLLELEELIREAIENFSQHSKRCDAFRRNSFSIQVPMSREQFKLI